MNKVMKMLKMSPVAKEPTVIKSANGFSVKFDYGRLEDFKAHFEKCKWNAAASSWEVPAEYEEELLYWVEKYFVHGGTVTSAREGKIAVYRAKQAEAKKAVDDLRAQTNRAIAVARAEKEAKHEAVRVITQRIGSLSLRARYGENDAKTQAAFEVIGADKLLSAIRAVLIGETKGFELANLKATITKAYNKLLEIGFTTPVLTALAVNAEDVKNFDPEGWIKLEPVSERAEASKLA